MRNENRNIEKEIRIKTLELLQEKEPYEIGMRDIARRCGVSATAIYLYYKDKDDLFRKISLDCLHVLEIHMRSRLESVHDPVEKIIVALKTYRDWCFENAKTAMLFMGKITVDPEADTQALSEYYGCNRMGQQLFEMCVKEKIFSCVDVVTDTNVLIYGLWGCIESVLLMRADLVLLEKGIEYTDRFIEIAIKGLKN